MWNQIFMGGRLERCVLGSEIWREIISMENDDSAPLFLWLRSGAVSSCRASRPSRRRGCRSHQQAGLPRTQVNKQHVLCHASRSSSRVNGNRAAGSILGFCLTLQKTNSSVNHHNLLLPALPRGVTCHVVMSKRKTKLKKTIVYLGQQGTNIYKIFHT